MRHRVGECLEVRIGGRQLLVADHELFVQASDVLFNFFGGRVQVALVHHPLEGSELRQDVFDGLLVERTSTHVLLGTHIDLHGKRHGRAVNSIRPS